MRGKKSLLAGSGVIGAHPGTAPAQSRIWQPRKLSKPVGATTSGSGLGSDRATLSSAGSEVLLTAGEDGVRTDKVASVQAALAASS